METYDINYERHYQKYGLNGSGGGPPKAMGILQLGILINAGLRHDHKLLDFGCGIGRLTKYATKYLKSGLYVGTDISRFAIEETKKRYQNKNSFFVLNQYRDLKNIETVCGEFDFIAAYSVFTHIELEDYYTTLKELKKLSNNRTILVASFLDFKTVHGKKIFENEAQIPYGERYKRFRNIVSTYETTRSVASLAGWTLQEWIEADTILDELIPNELAIEAEVDTFSIIQAIGIFNLN